ncbi:MAG: hypothetical protein ACYTFZ_01045 [Planctomycetota bacterium]|jgi:hypothetical protein
MTSEKKARLVPYEMVSPGFEAVYTGDEAPELPEGYETVLTYVKDESGNVMARWSSWTWTLAGQEGSWGAEIRHINQMQVKLGPLDENTRRIRAQIGSMVPCDSGFPVTVDELLDAIGKGELREPSFHDGCWAPCAWWAERTTQPHHADAMQAIRDVLTAYLDGKPKEDSVRKFPAAKRFINRTYRWLGPAQELTQLQRLMLERMLLPFEYLAGRNADAVAAYRLCFDEGGRGAQLDAEIAELTGLPEAPRLQYGEYDKRVKTVSDPQARELFKVCARIASGIYELSDCHHNTFRVIENQIYGIATGKLGIPSRHAGAERQRLGRLLAGYVLGLDSWLAGVPMQFLLLDCGHVDLGFDPKNEILRVYAYLGAEKTPVKEWLAACLWHNLSNNAHGGLQGHPDVLERVTEAGISLRRWADSALGDDSCGGR